MEKNIKDGNRYDTQVILSTGKSIVLTVATCCKYINKWIKMMKYTHHQMNICSVYSLFQDLIYKVY